MSKTFLKFATHVGERLDKVQTIFSANRLYSGWREKGFPEQHSPDFRPELIQDFYFQTAMYMPYINSKDYYRVYMPLRLNRVEANTKYMNQIIGVVNKYTPHLVSNF